MFQECAVHCSTGKILKTISATRFSQVGLLTAANFLLDVKGGWSPVEVRFVLVLCIVSFRVFVCVCVFVVLPCDFHSFVWKH